MGTFTFPHHTSALESECSTTRLSLGERPVFSPEKAISAPVSAMSHLGSSRIASVYSAAGDRLRRTSPTVIPYCFRSKPDTDETADAMVVPSRRDWISHPPHASGVG